MTLEELKLHMMAVPFKPFTLNIADGRRIPVPARDFILTPLERGRTVIVYQVDERHDVLDLMLITGITFEAPP